MLNAVYGQVPILHPGLLGSSDNEGADAIKLAVAGSLGIRVHYYALVNLQGFREVVDAIGGVTVNINQPVPIGGSQDRGVPPVGYLEPGPDQRLDGFEALWFARGRYGLDDYDRMLRQRCLVQAMIEEAHPFNLLRRYQRLAAAGKEIARTDIPSELLPAFVDLIRKVKGAQVTSIAFVSSGEFYPGDPDFEWLRAQVQKALKPTPGSTGDRGPSRGGLEPPATAPAPDLEDDPGAEARLSDNCGYQPIS
jgi:LCP family protein required for cell wall assembly